MRLYTPRVESARALEVLDELQEPLRISALNVYELENALRFASWLHRQDHHKGIAADVATAALALFEQDIEAGKIRVVDFELKQVLSLARDISHRRTWSGGFRSMDILLVATARALGCTTFLSFDLQQRKLAEFEGLKVDF